MGLADRYDDDFGFDDFDEVGDTTRGETTAGEATDNSSDTADDANNIDTESSEYIQQDSHLQQDNNGTEYILYIITDRYIPGMINVFRESGLAVSTIFDNVTDAKNEMLMQAEPTRLVLIDTGTGKFTTTSTRAEIIDMLGISDEQNKTTVFYTDSVLKIDTIKALGKVGKNIDWLQYESTTIVIATLLQYQEKYKFDCETSNDILEDEASILSFRGTASKLPETDRYKINGFTADELLQNMIESTDNQLKGYTVKIR